MQCAWSVLYCHLWPARLYKFFSTLSHKRHDFRKKVYRTQNVCFDFLYQFSLKTFLILRRTEWDMTKIFIGLCVSYPLFLSDFKETWIFLIYLRKMPKKPQISWESLQWEQSCSMRADRQTDRYDEASSHNFYVRLWKWRMNTEANLIVSPALQFIECYTQTNALSIQ